MPRSDQTFRHARAALDHCAWSIASLRSQIAGTEACRTKRQRFILRGILHDLEKRRDLLRDLHAEMAVHPEALAQRWAGFMAGYGDFLRIAHAGRAELARGEWRDILRMARGDDNAAL